MLLIVIIKIIKAKKKNGVLIVKELLESSHREFDINGELLMNPMDKKYNNNNAATITRYIHIKHADSSVKIFRETTV